MLIKDASPCILGKQNILARFCRGGRAGWRGGGRRMIIKVEAGSRGLWSMRGDRAIGVWAAIMY